MKPKPKKQQLPVSWSFLLVPFATVFVSLAFFALGCAVRGNPGPHLRERGIDDIRAFALFVYGIGNGILILILRILLKRKCLSLHDVGFRKCEMGRLLGYAAATTTAAFLLYPTIEYLVGLCGLPMYWNPEQSTPVSKSSVLSLLFIFFGAVVLAPLGEETVFRGYLFSMLRSRTRVPVAALVSSLLFAAVHLPFFGPGFAVYIVPWSLLSCLLIIRLHSLYPSLVFHLTNNLIAYMILPWLTA